MRWPTVLAAAAALGIAGVAMADFVISSQVQDAASGFERVLFYAFNDGANGTGTKALASDVTLADANDRNMIVKFVAASVGRAATSRWDATGSAFLGSGGLPTDSDRTFVNLLPDPSDPNYDPAAYSLVALAPPPNIRSNFTDGYPRIEVVGANLSGGVNATTSNGGRGALIAVAVAPAGDPIHAFGSIGGDTGSAQAFDAISQVPEPAVWGPVAVGLAWLLSNRRRGNAAPEDVSARH